MKDFERFIDDPKFHNEVSRVPFSPHKSLHEILKSGNEGTKQIVIFSKLTLSSMKDLEVERIKLSA